MWDEIFPRSILYSILSCKLNLLDEMDMEEAADVVCPETNTNDEAVVDFDHDNIDHVVTLNDEDIVYETDLLDSVSVIMIGVITKTHHVWLL